MSWLRIDDGFTSNTKIAGLSDGEFRCWMRVLCHCARSQDPTVDEATIREVSGLTKARVAKLSRLGLIDAVGDAHEVHDWTHYLPKDTAAERQAKWRSRRSTSQKNGHVRDLVDQSLAATNT